MFEARLTQGVLLKKILEAVKELITDSNLDCSQTGITLQAMDSAHVSLVSLLLRSDGFEHYRCDRTMSLGLSLVNLGKILKCAGNDDIVTMKAEDNSDTISFMFESPNQDKISDFELKLMDIDSEHLGIPETEYTAVVRMPSSEFQRVVRDLSAFGDSAVISVNKEGIKFTVTGDVGTGNIIIRQGGGSAEKKEEDQQVVIDLQEPVTLAFALKYLNNFGKAGGLSPTVTISLSQEVPLCVEYKIQDIGYLRFYLAPKIDEEGQQQ
mmetsp:Transcript_6218/g.10716  ORF Transcript_6218/g.10716 Transcript_6218/m.10716 type:complete len:266 (-) Transcript_6218:701-1498(-)|eukprot:CAMPEP_0196657716 /NCGR_PEP_ID=MMETSP1086-20130531/25107_1 /TAXON_ID=77921 /ORGANISM="Cyanoptyche  gloeocystis , Strain SAG4.97" /LENGTH=265 /DNA_ID=CAMNT_0041990959 /DNA_START=106 /DNA_END=903 /DNA_ORIENTATION=-